MKNPFIEKKEKKAHKTRSAATIWTKSGLRLTAKQDAFCDVYTDYSNKKTFLNATESMLATHTWEGKREYATTYAGKIKRHPVVTARIRELLEMKGFNDNDVDGEHLKVIKQDKDLSNKMRGIQEYNRLKGRGAQQGATVNVNIINFQDVLRQRDNNTVSVRSQHQTVSVGDTGERSEE